MARRTGLRAVLFAAFAIAATAGVGITIAALDVTGLTDAGGAHRITGLAAGSQEVRFTRIGYVSSPSGPNLHRSQQDTSTYSVLQRRKA